MTLVFSTQINSEQELSILAEKILATIPGNSIVLLSGSLASGKTTLVLHFCKLFGIFIAQSPTYAIHQRYTNKEMIIDHFDLYRLESEDDIQASGFYNLLNDSAGYKFIEWAERIKIQDIPYGKPLYQIAIKIVGVNSRQIDLHKLA